jgi:L-lactate dehydrogenase (cytochrome)
MEHPTRCLNAHDFEVAARRRLPRPLYDYIAGGADDEVTMRANSDAFSRYQFAPRYLRDVGKINMRRKVLGCELEWPLLLAPTGMNRLFHPAGEIAVATEAARIGAGYCLSTMATASIEDISAACRGAKIYQLYMLADEQQNLASIDRCKAAGYDAICLTVDTIVAGNRERDLRSGLTVPPRLSLSSLAHFAMRPKWCARYLAGGRISLPNVPTIDGGDVSTLAAYFAANMEADITWQKVERLIAHWGGPFAIKGLQTVDDAIAASDVGTSAVIVSNHGGRQLDGASATIDLIADITDALGGRIEVILDGGVRRGSHIVKALAMGATACMTGRPYLYGLAAYGQMGVRRALELLRTETERTMALIGCGSLDDLSRDHIRLAETTPAFLTRRAGQLAL